MSLRDVCGDMGLVFPGPFANPFRTLWSRLYKTNLPESGKGSSQVKGKRQKDHKFKRNL
jgi:hypothetical protein